MILEVADFRTHDPDDFEAAMHEMADLIASADGYRGHRVERSIESPSRYLLLVHWDSVEAHLAFRETEAFDAWRTRLGPHRENIHVEHTRTVLEHS